MFFLSFFFLNERNIQPNMKSIHIATFIEQLSKQYNICKPSKRIGMQQYVDRIRKYMSPSDYVIAAAIWHMWRLMTSHRACHRLRHTALQLVFFGCVTLSHKYIEDSVYSIQFLARVGGVQPAHAFGVHEMTLFQLLNYTMYTDVETCHHVMEVVLTPDVSTRREMTIENDKHSPTIEKTKDI